MLRRGGGWPSPEPGVRGTTLIEVVVAMAIAALPVVAVYGLIFSAVRSFSLTEDLLEAQQATRFITERITEEARWAESVLPDVGCRPLLICPNRVTLHVPASNPIRPGLDYDVTFRHDLRTQTVVRQQGREEQVLGDSVAALKFSFFTPTDEVASQPEEVARIQLVVTVIRTSAGRAQRRTIQTAILLRNLRPEASLVTPGVDASLGPVWRPVPGSPAAVRQAPPPNPSPPAPESATSSGSATTPGGTRALAQQPPCPSAPDPPPRLPPRRPEVRDARVEVLDWVFSLEDDGTLAVTGEVGSSEPDQVRGVRISATGYGLSGTVTGSAAATISSIDEDDTQPFTLRLSAGLPAVWVVFKVEQYLPRSSAPMHEVVASVPLSIYKDEAKKRLQVSTTVLPQSPSSRHTACVMITDFAAFPVDSVRVRVVIVAAGEPVVTETTDVRAGRTAWLQVTWPRNVIVTATVTVEEVRFLESDGGRR